MTAYTANTSGDWNNATTWSGAGTPSVNGDTWVINSGVVVDMNVDLSALTTGLGAGTINGTLRAKRSAGIYYLKQNATITVSTTGTLDASDGSGGAYLSTATFTILLNGAFSITVAGNGVVNLICGEPVTKYVKLTQIEAIASTTLHVDTDVSADALWAGALIRIDNINQAKDSEERTVSGTPSSTVITITAGLTAAKALGAYVILVTRNVKILGASTASGTGINGGTNGIIGAEVRQLNTGFTGGGTGHSIGGTVTNIGAGSALNGGDTFTVNASISAGTNGIIGGRGFLINGIISGQTDGINAGAAHILSPTSIISGCANAVDGSAAPLLMGSLVNCATAVNTGSGHLWRGATMNNNTRDLSRVCSGQAFNSLFGSGTEFLNYNAASRSIIDYVESLDHDQTGGAYRAWTRGGITSSVASPVYDNRVRSYNAVPESATYYAFWQRQVVVPAYGSINVAVAVQKDTSMAYLPNVQIFPSSMEPLISGSATLTLTMTNSTNTWEVLEGTVTNNTDAAVYYTVRMLAKNASGNVYWSPVIRVSSYQVDAGMSGGMAA